MNSRKTAISRWIIIKRCHDCPEKYSINYTDSSEILQWFRISSISTDINVDTHSNLPSILCWLFLAIEPLKIYWKTFYNKWWQTKKNRSFPTKEKSLFRRFEDISK